MDDRVRFRRRHGRDVFVVSLRRTELRQPVGVLFSRCKPRFSTSYGRYARAKLAYVGAMIVMYMAFSLVPELFNKAANIGAGDDP